MVLLASLKKLDSSSAGELLKRRDPLRSAKERTQ